MQEKSIDEILLKNGFDILENGCCYTDKHRIERAMQEYANQLVGDKEREHEYLLSTTVKGYENILSESKSALLQAQKECEELKDLLRDIDKSLYIGKDLDDTEILKWYLDVCQTIKESTQEKLNSEPEDKRSVARDDDSSTSDNKQKNEIH